MIRKKAQVGQLVKSTTGRDKGKLYLVSEVLNDIFVQVIDGEKRRLTNPKKKNVRHLELLPVKADFIAEKLRRGKTVKEEEVIGTIKLLGLSDKFE